MPTQSPSQGNARSLPGDALCVLWHPRGSEPAGDLVDSLRRKGFRTISCDNPVEAAAWLCTSHKPHRSHPAMMPRAVVLLLDRPADLPGVSDMLDMFGTYCPKSVCWSHDPDASPRLQAISTDDKSMASQGMHPQPGTPTLRLAGEGPIHEIKDAPQGDMDLGESEPPIPRTLRETLSDEELSMLLDEPPTYERRQHP